MNKPARNVLTLLVSIAFFCTASYAATESKTPEHFFNPPENINPDPAYVPGDYVLPDMAQALAQFKAAQKQLAEIKASKGDRLFRTKKEDGEVSVTVIKNEKAPVLAYFRDFDGYILFREEKFSEAKLIISVNSWDSAVPGRDNRVRAIFFESMNSKKALATLHLTRIGDGTMDFEKLKKDGPHKIEAGGVLILGGILRPVRPMLEIQWDGKGWNVKSAEPLHVLISDFKLDGNLLALMKQCNHKSIGNSISIEWNLKFGKA